MTLIRNIMVWQFCLLLGFSLYINSSSQVLCLSDAGDFKIEEAHQEDRCASDYASAAQDREYPDHDCGSCSDIPLNSQQLWHHFPGSSKHLVSIYSLAQSSAIGVNGSTINDLSGSTYTIASALMLTFSIEPAPTVLRC